MAPQAILLHWLERLRPYLNSLRIFEQRRQDFSSVPEFSLNDIQEFYFVPPRVLLVIAFVRIALRCLV